MHSLPTTLFLAKEMGTRLGKRKILLRAMQKGIQKIG